VTRKKRQNLLKETHKKHWMMGSIFEDTFHLEVASLFSRKPPWLWQWWVGRLPLRHLQWGTFTK
jgi:hypothetical protein